jgi:hypothetical protein
LEEFLELSYNSNKWKKWIIDLHKHKSDYEKSVISGHYIFSTEKFLNIKQRLSKDINLSIRDMDLILKDSVKSSILRYVENFGLLS